MEKHLPPLIFHSVYCAERQSKTRYKGKARYRHSMCHTQTLSRARQRFKQRRRKSPKGCPSLRPTRMFSQSCGHTLIRRVESAARLRSRATLDLSRARVPCPLPPSHQNVQRPATKVGAAQVPGRRQFHRQLHQVG